MDHRAHLCLAFELLVTEGGVAAATAAFRNRFGQASKYDEGVTRAYFAILADRMESASASADDFLARNPDLLQLRVVKP